MPSRTHCKSRQTTPEKLPVQLLGLVQETNMCTCVYVTIRHTAANKLLPCWELYEKLMLICYISPCFSIKGELQLSNTFRSRS